MSQNNIELHTAESISARLDRLPPTKTICVLVIGMFGPNTKNIALEAISDK